MEGVRRDFVRGEVLNLTQELRSDYLYYEFVRLDPSDVKEFLKKTPEALKEVDAEILAFLRETHTPPSEKYDAEVSDHLYHMQEIEKRVMLVEKLLPRVDRIVQEPLVACRV